MARRRMLLAKCPFARDPAVADKPEFVDMISEATHQLRRRRIAARRSAPQGNLASQSLAAGHWEQWRMETLTPWKIKPWKARTGINPEIEFSCRHAAEEKREARLPLDGGHASLCRPLYILLASSEKSRLPLCRFHRPLSRGSRREAGTTDETRRSSPERTKPDAEGERRRRRIGIRPIVDRPIVVIGGRAIIAVMTIVAPDMSGAR